MDCAIWKGSFIHWLTFVRSLLYLSEILRYPPDCQSGLENLRN